MRIFAMLLVMLLILPATAQKRTRTDATVIPSINEGITYSLPRTGIRVSVNACQTTFVPGPYVAFAEQLLGIRDAKTQAQTFWVITEVSFTTFSEPDPANTYKAGGDAALLQLTASGILAGINSTNDMISCGTSVSNSFATPNKATHLTFTNLIDNPAFTGRTSIEQRAVQAANRILRARNVRFDIATGMLDEFHPDGEAYEESLEELRRIETDLLNLFIGKSVTEKYTFNFDYIPQSSVRGEVIFRFDENRGFLPKSDLSGKPVMIDVERNENLALRLSAVKGEQATLQGFNGVFYRQPGMADIRIVWELTIIASGRATIAQFGEVIPVPRELLDGTYSIDLHPETGGIRNIYKK